MSLTLLTTRRIHTEALNGPEKLLLIIMRSVEELLHTMLDWAIIVCNWPYMLIMSVMPKYEWYIDPATGNLRRRRFTGNRGSYGYRNGKMVKLSDTAEFVNDEFTVMGWTEQMSGKVDEALGPIESKQDYRRKMKEKGWIPKESMQFSKKNMEQRLMQNIVKRDKKKEVENFKEAVYKAEGITGHEFD